MPEPRYSPAPCPRCGRLIEASGEATLVDGTLPIYVCDSPTCTKPFTFDNETIQAPLVFAFGADGRTVVLDLADWPPERR